METAFLNPLPLLYLHEFSSIMLRERITPYQDNRALIGLIDKDKDKLVSMMGWKRNFMKHNEVTILSVWTNPDYRKQGFFKKLFDKFELMIPFIEADCFHASCTKYSINEFLKRGFKETGERIGELICVKLQYKND